MKKITFFVALLMTGSLAVAQIALSEDFSGGQMPPDGWSISAHPTNWSVQTTANAGGAAPEARFSWTPQFSGLTHLVSPSLDLSDNDSGVLLISFRHMLDHYGGAYSLGLAVRTNGGAWNNVWQIVNPTGNIPAQEVSVELDGSEVSSNDLQLGFFFSGNSFNINFWYLDDIQVMIPQEFDLAVNSITVPALLAVPTPVTGSVVNLGSDPINSFDLHWQVDQGEIHTTSFSGLELELGEQLSFEADDMLDLDPGTYELTVSISNMNGEPADDTPENDSMSQTVSVAYDTAPRRPLFEMFTSSTCPPCATFNNGFFNNFTYSNAEDITLIKYQMNWPGAGDPYYTPEGGVRRTYYGVSGVPALMLEGNQVATSGSDVPNALQQALQVPAFMHIEGSYEIDGDHISIEGTVMPYATFPESRLHVAVIESVTYGNAGTNGETEFHHVMHKMMPNAQGTVVNLSANEAYHFSFDHDMSTTNVEEMDELMVVVFVQHHESQEIYQSAYMTRAASENFWVIHDVNAFPGETISINVEIINDDIFYGFQGHIVLPDGFGWVQGSQQIFRDAGHIFSFSSPPGEPNSVSFFAFAIPSAPFSGNDGVVVSFDLTTPEEETIIELLVEGASISGINGNIQTGSLPGIITLEGPTYAVTFDIKDDLGNPIHNAIVTLGETENAAGDYVFSGLVPDTYDYTVALLCYRQRSGIIVVDDDKIQEVVMSNTPGDANGDGIVDVLDLVLLIGYFTGTHPGSTCLVNYDINGDGIVDILDIILAINIYLLPFDNTVIDIDGNLYQTVIIGSQEWMAENLRVTRYNNEDDIPTGLSYAEWESTTSGAYAIYNNDDDMLEAYGKLYNWYAVDDARGLCPQGWSVPSHGDWTQLEQYICNALGNSDCEIHFPNDNTTLGWRGTNEGNALKSCRQVDSPLEGCNTSEHPRWKSHSTHYGFDEFGFSALPGGSRGTAGNYGNMGSNDHSWSSSEHSSTDAWSRDMYRGLGSVGRGYGNKQHGFGVRCVRDALRTEYD